MDRREFSHSGRGIVPPIEQSFISIRRTTYDNRVIVVSKPQRKLFWTVFQKHAHLRIAKSLSRNSIAVGSSRKLPANESTAPNGGNEIGTISCLAPESRRNCYGLESPVSFLAEENNGIQNNREAVLFRIVAQNVLHSIVHGNVMTCSGTVQTGWYREHTLFAQNQLFDTLKRFTQLQFLDP